MATEEEVKRQILQLFERKDEWDYVEMLSETGFDLDILVKVCNQLEEEGICTIVYNGESSVQHGNLVKV